MKKFTLLTLSFILALMFLTSCSGDSDSSDDKQAGPQPGKITARTEGITGQNGKYVMVAVYDYDWFPGSEDATRKSFAGSRGTITNNDFSFTEVLKAVDTAGNPIAEDKIFAAGTYSVVFFVGAPGSPPQSFVEVRATVDGDVTVSAPSWKSWGRP